MATTFDVFYLGTAADIDPTEGNTTSENAGAIVGNTYGSVGDPLVDHIQTLSPGTAGYAGGTAAGYDVDNAATNDQFRIDGGPDQTMDGMGIYNATITYTDGTTGTITATVFQDTAGRLYLAPEVTANTDQTALEAKPIRALTLDSLSSANSHVFGDRVAASYAVCFTAGTAIRTPRGDRLIEDLSIGDAVCTLDNGPQIIRWIGRKDLNHATLMANPNLRPILIRQGAFGAARDLLVSPQHGMLLGGGHLVRAKHMVGAPGSRVRIAHGKRRVSYIHLMFEAHQIIFAENAPAESFYPGPMAQRILDPAARAELRHLFPAACPPALCRSTIAAGYGDTARLFLPRKAVAGEMRLVGRVA